MLIQKLKRWHWILIGAFVGVMMAHGYLLIEADRWVGGREFITQAMFESELRYPPILGKPALIHIVIHLSRATDVVSMSELDTSTLQYRDRWFASPRPYTPIYGIRDRIQSQESVKEYL